MTNNCINITLIQKPPAFSFTKITGGFCLYDLIN